jgi:hypothetical protein
VNDVLADWCGLAPIDQTTSLKSLWESTADNPNRPHNGVPFQPDGVGELLIKLDVEFTKPNEILKETSRLTANHFRPSGNIDSVDDLVTTVKDAQMSLRRRVNIVLHDWCGEQPNNIDQTISLDVLWIATRNNPDRPHNGVDFQPLGVADLLSKLTTEFKKPGDVRKQISVLTLNSFKPNGDIDSVDDLVGGVLGCPNLPPIPEGD